MPDKFSKKTRSKIMSRIRSKNTKPELALKKLLKGTYFRYQPKAYGKPDFALKNKRITIFIDGCFWHKCPICYKTPKSNRKYWLPKIKRNIERAKEVEKSLKKEGWRVLRFWEHEVTRNGMRCLNKVNLLFKE